MEQAALRPADASGEQHQEAVCGLGNRDLLLVRAARDDLQVRLPLSAGSWRAARSETRPDPSRRQAGEMPPTEECC